MIKEEIIHFEITRFMIFMVKKSLRFEKISTIFRKKTFAFF